MNNQIINEVREYINEAIKSGVPSNVVINRAEESYPEVEYSEIERMVEEV